MMRQSPAWGRAAKVHRDAWGMKMTAELIIFEPNRSTRSDSVDEADRLLSALGEYTSAELLELLYVGQEPGFFELVRGLFALSEESRLGLQNFLANAPRRGTTGAVDPEGRFVLQHRTLDSEENFRRHNPQ
jgi:hypothetical protein